jgi:DNA (cytosine-5)-methyltransferase 1
MRYVVNAAEPFIVPVGYGERDGQQPRTASIGKPLATAVGTNKHALVTAFLAKHYTGVVGSALVDPLATVTSVDHHSLVTASMQPLGHGEGRSRSHHAEVRAFLLKYYGTDQNPSFAEPMHTITTKHRFGLVTVRGEDYAIVDIGLRMLTPRELFRAQGFPEHYAIHKRADGSPLSKTAQVRMCGNSVCPPVAEAIIRANYSEMQALQMAA